MTYSAQTQVQEREAVIKAFGVKSFRAALRKVYLKEHPFCFFCGLRLVWENSTVDHLLAQAHFKGSEKPKVLSCISCNQLKKDRDVTEFLVWMHETKGLIYNKQKAGFHFYKLCPQNSNQFAVWAERK